MWSRKFIDLTGFRFGRLYVIGLASEKRCNKPAWLCRCDCGRVKVVPGDPLRMGKTRSCGCLHKELVAEQAPMAAAARCRLHRAVPPHHAHQSRLNRPAVGDYSA